MTKCLQIKIWIRCFFLISNNFGKFSDRIDMKYSLEHQAKGNNKVKLSRFFIFPATDVWRQKLWSISRMMVHCDLQHLETACLFYAAEVGTSKAPQAKPQSSRFHSSSPPPDVSTVSAVKYACALFQLWFGNCCRSIVSKRGENGQQSSIYGFRLLG